MMYLTMMRTGKLAVLPLVLLLPAQLYSAASGTEGGRSKKKNEVPVVYREVKEADVDPAVLSAPERISMGIVSSIDESAVDTAAPKEAPKYWTNGLKTQIGVSQVSLTNWAEGGEANVALNAYIDGHANYEKDKMIFENRLKLSYGFIQSFAEGTPYKEQFKKSDDRIQLDSKWGWQVYDRLYVSALFDFRTQFTPTYDDNSALQSKFMAPGYFSIGAGINYKPFNFLSFNISPVTGNFVVVTEEALRETYGNAIDETVRAELGAQIKMDIKYTYKTFSVGSYLTLFSDYLNNPQNIQVRWDFEAGLSLGKFFTLTLRTNLIYDDNIRIDNGNGNPVPRVQFKEIMSLGFTYTLGNYIKDE